jgi:hypothetical protein
MSGSRGSSARAVAPLRSGEMSSGPARRIHRAALLVSSMALTACRAVLGIDEDPPAPEEGTTVSTGTSPQGPASSASITAAGSGGGDATITSGASVGSGGGGQGGDGEGGAGGGDVVPWALQIGGVNQPIVAGVAFSPAGRTALAIQFSGVMSVGSGDIAFDAGADVGLVLVMVEPDGDIAWTEQVEVHAPTDGRYLVKLAFEGDDALLVGGTVPEGASDFRIGGEAYENTNFADLFVARLDLDGSRLAGTSWSEGNSQVGVAMARVDDAIYLTGTFCGSLTLDDCGPATTTGCGDFDAFVARLGADLQCDMLRTYPAADFQQGYGIAANDEGDILLTGAFRGTLTFGGTAGELNTQVTAPVSEGYVAKLDENGDGIWAHLVGPDMALTGFLDEEGDAFVSGGLAAPPTFLFRGGPQSHGGTDVFAARLGGAGTPRWAEMFGGAADDGGYLGRDALGDRIRGHFAGQVAFSSDVTLTGSPSAGLLLGVSPASGAVISGNAITGTSAVSVAAASALGDGTELVLGYFIDKVDIAGATLTNTQAVDLYLARRTVP